MRSQLTAQFMPFFRLIARILTFCDKKYRILTFCDKTELYLTVLQQNNVEACLRALSGLLSCALWLPLARSCSFRLPIALRICVQHPRSAHKAPAQLAAALLRCNTLCCSGTPNSKQFDWKRIAWKICWIFFWYPNLTPTAGNMKWLWLQQPFLSFNIWTMRIALPAAAFFRYFWYFVFDTWSLYS